MLFRSNTNQAYVEETGGGSTTVATSVTLKVTLVDKDNNPIQDAQVAIYKTSDNTQLMNEDTLASGIAEETFNYPGSTVDIYVRARKSSTGATKYIPVSTTGTITASGYTTKITLYDDPNA